MQSQAVASIFDESKKQSSDGVLVVNSCMYLVRSYSQPTTWYRINRLLNADIWQCTCYDFARRLRKNNLEKKCKHIVQVQALRSSLEIKHGLEDSNILATKPKICTQCYSKEIKKSGFRTLKNGTKRQRYTCLYCNYRFLMGENGFRKVKYEPMLIQEALNLVMCGLSYRNVARHLRETNGMRIWHTTIDYWFKKYMTIIKGFVDSILLPPNQDETWSVDEMMVNVKNTRKTGFGFYVWFWSIIDPQTRFIVASEVSKSRYLQDAKRILSAGLIRTTTEPKFIITDSLMAYENAICDKFGMSKVAHIRTNSFKDGFQNLPIERYHNEMRSVLASKRGLGNDNSAQTFADAYRIYHNYIRPHSGLGNSTPAEAIGLDLNLGENKILSLIQKGTEYKYDFKKQLGKRLIWVDVSEEKDCTKVTPKTWLKKQTWRETNDILRLNGFGWVSGQPCGCWIR